MYYIYINKTKYRYKRSKLVSKQCKSNTRMYEQKSDYSY